ncbi:hypothetical protein ACUXTG_001811 [Staphylococcus capitis]
MKLLFLYIGIIILMTLSVALIFDVFIAFAIFIFSVGIWIIFGG